MALIMFSGMFGFGEMVSYISFMGDGGRGCWCGCLVTAGSDALKDFTFLIGPLNYACWIFLLRTSIWNVTLHCLLFFFISDTIKHFSAMGFGEDCQYLLWHIFSEAAIFKHHVPLTDLVNAHVNFIALFIFVSNGAPVSSSCTRKNSPSVCGVILLIKWLCCGAKTPGGEVFVRSFVSHYPEGFSAPYFFCSKSPGYTSVISLLPSPPSQLKDTVGID